MNGVIKQPTRNAYGELPKFTSHKTVHALKIAAIEIHEDRSATIVPKNDCFSPFEVDADWVSCFKRTDDDPGYYVVYKDGYKSWSPSQAFEDGYTLIS